MAVSTDTAPSTRIFSICFWSPHTSLISPFPDAMKECKSSSAMTIPSPGSCRPVKQCTKCRTHAGMSAPWHHHGRWTAMPDPPYTTSGMHLRFQARIWSHMTARRALNQHDNCVTSDQNCHKLLLFQLLRVDRFISKFPLALLTNFPIFFHRFHSKMIRLCC